MLGTCTTLKIDEAGASAICAYDSCCRELAADSARRNKPPLISFVIALGPLGTVVQRFSSPCASLCLPLAAKALLGPLSKAAPGTRRAAPSPRIRRKDCMTSRLGGESDRVVWGDSVSFASLLLE